MIGTPQCGHRGYMKFQRKRRPESTNVQPDEAGLTFTGLAAKARGSL